MDTRQVCDNINQLVEYGLEKKLINKSDKIWVRNQLLNLLGMDNYEEIESCQRKELPVILDNLVGYAVEQGLTGDSITEHDLFDTRLMGVLTPRPSEVIGRFNELYNQSPKEATDWYYEFSNDSNYIRRDRIAKDMKWQTQTEYGPLDITINLSKPEKDPKAIAAAGRTQTNSYPKCQLCIENEGYAGRLDHPARENHRIIPLKFEDEDWSFQFSPYVYYNEHCIVLNNQHKPMVINKRAMRRLLDFVDQFSHYFIGSNADLPIVGGSILSHEHFQGGHYTFAMEKAPVEESFTLEEYPDISVGIVKWPMSVIRLEGKDKESILDLADTILGKWRNYSDESVGILSESEGEPHNTITPIARRNGDAYQLDLVLRNNRTDEEHPLGIFHPHNQWHHIKKENIGLIEVMGLAVLPARLKNEIALVKEVILENKPPEDYPELKSHLDWIGEIKEKYKEINQTNIDSIIENEIGEIFKHVLEDAGVFKRDEEGQAAFRRFIETIKE